MEFSTLSIHRLIKNQGGKRVPDSSADELGEHLEQYAEAITEEAIEIAREEGFKTLKKRHIKQAVKESSQP